jgi:hypothetical protein
MTTNNMSNFQANTQVNPLQVREFRVQFNIGQPRNYTIDNIHDLNEMIRIYGRGIIQSITFYFYDNQHQFHNLILQNAGHNDRFVVEFFHYYDSHFRRLEQSREQQHYDFVSIMNVLTSQQILQSRLVPFIINPFHQIQMS